MLSAAQGKLEFKRHDLHTTVSSNRGCLLVYPPSGSSKKSGRQRVAVGDSSGVVTVFQVGKHHDLQTQFETGPLGKPISRLALYQDQLFAAAGSKISAFSRKGKLFFFFDNNMTEAVKSFHVDTPLIFAGGDYTLTYFQESTEKGFYMSPDRINDLVALPARSQLDASSGGDASEPTLAAYHSYLACQDRALRVVRQTELVGEVNCEASLSSLTHMRDGEHAKRKFLVYGTSAGSIGVFALNKRDELVRRHSVIPETRLGVISALASFDVTEDGVSDIIVGREDGSIEVHACGTSAHSEAPQLVWSGNVGEYINTVAGGNITQTEREELLLHSFSGKVVSFALSAEDEEVRRIVPNVMSSQAPALPTAQEKISTTAAAASKVKKSSRDADDEAAAAAASALEITHAKVVEASKEIEKLRSLLDTKRNEYATVTKQQTAASAPVATPAGATAPPPSHVKLRAVTSEFKVRDSLSVDGAAALLLSIESDVALEVVTVQSEVAFEVLDSESTALMSNHTLPDGGQQVPPGGRPTAMLCVLRPAEDRPKRVHVTLRAHEGEYGSIQAFVIPKTVPRTAQLRTFKLLPLALHVRISESDAEWSTLPLSSVTLTGPFTIRDAHSWMLSCIPDVPEVVQVNSETASLYYRNQFEGTVLSVRYEKGQIVVLSDNFNALAIMKTHLTKEATNRKMSLKMESQPLESSLRRHLFSLTPLIAYQCGLSAKLQLVDALKELEGQEDTAALLDDEYKEVLASASTLQEESRLQPRRLEYLRHIVLNLAKQKCVFFGQSFTPHLQRELLMSLGDVTGGASLSSPPSAAASLSTAPSAAGGVPQSSQMNADRGSSTGVASGGDSNGAMNGSRGDHTTAKHIVFDAPRMFKLFGVSMEDPEENGSSVRGGGPGEGMPPPPLPSSVPMFSAEEVVMPTAPPQEALIL